MANSAAPARMASWAASQIDSGVGKSGSPSEKESTSLPAALSSRAFWATAIVAEGLMTSRREASFSVDMRPT